LGWGILEIGSFSTSIQLKIVVRCPGVLLLSKVDKSRANACHAHVYPRT
jgi:hypothetical protein